MILRSASIDRSNASWVWRRLLPVGAMPPRTSASASTAIGENCASAPPPTKPGARGACETLLAATERDRAPDPLTHAGGDCGCLPAGYAVEHVHLELDERFACQRHALFAFRPRLH